MKLWTRIGIILMVFAFIVLFLFIIFPAVLPSFDDAPFLKNTFRTLFCKPGEMLQDEHDTYNPRPGETDTTVSLSCVDNEGNARDVGSAPIVVGMVGYLVPFLGGLALWTIGNNKQKQLSAQSAAANFSSFNTYESGSNTLSDRLRELKSAFDSGLITQAEYDAKRKEILNET